VNQDGGGNLPSADAGWAGEISLDVEWAHAIAPAASILLVEANSSDTNDLMAAVNYARNAPDVSVVSMSWGGSEFFDWGGGESDSQLTYDPDFTTPAGHQGVTFIASAGDSGSRAGVQWPASSPNVLSVGGTTLNLSDDSGTYGSESGWSGTSSGYSQVETEPDYQLAVQDTGARSVADVAYDADPNTGLATYDSVPYEGVSGWQVVGGTSAGAPQWAALVAIADQGRVLNGEGTLDGASQTMSTLYALYSAPGTSGYSTYASYFNDVTTGGGGSHRFRWGGSGSSGNSAAPGYDLITGLGSPKAASLVDALIGTSGSSSGGSSSSGGGGGGSTSPSDLPASPISGTLAGSLPATAVSGQAGTLALTLTNISDTSFNGPVTVTLYASSDGTLSTDSTFITTLSVTNLAEKLGGKHTLKLNFDYPTALFGSYFLIASIAATETNTTNATAVTPASIEIIPPTVDLAVAFAGGKPIAVDPDKTEIATITVTNLGNVTASGALNLALYASTDGVLDSSDTLLSTITGRKIKIAAGKSTSIRVKFKAPADEVGGTYDLIGSIIPTTTPPDTNSSNDNAVIGTVPA